MKTAITRRRRSLLLAACAAGLVISTSACTPQLICGVLPGPTEAPAGQGK